MTLTIDSEDPYANQWSEGVFADDITEILKPLLRKDNVCIDVGANVGFVALYCSALAPMGLVHAIEPTPVTYALLAGNAKANASNIRTHNIALSNRNGEVAFSIQDHESYGNHIHGVAPPVNAISVSCITLDRFANENDFSRVDLIKIDVEGHELEELEGAKETLRKFSPVLIVEFNIWTQIAYGSVGPAQFLNYLLRNFEHILVIDSNGKLSRLTKDNWHHFIYARLHTDLVDNLLIANRIPDHLSHLFQDAPEFQWTRSNVPRAVLQQRLADAERQLSDARSQLGDAQSQLNKVRWALKVQAWPVLYPVKVARRWIHRAFGGVK